MFVIYYINLVKFKIIWLLDKQELYSFVDEHVCELWIAWSAADGMTLICMMDWRFQASSQLPTRGVHRGSNLSQFDASGVKCSSFVLLPRSGFVLRANGRWCCFPTTLQAGWHVCLPLRHSNQETDGSIQSMRMSKPVTRIAANGQMLGKQASNGLNMWSPKSQMLGKPTQIKRRPR